MKSGRDDSPVQTRLARGHTHRQSSEHQPSDVAHTNNIRINSRAGSRERLAAGITAAATASAPVPTKAATAAATKATATAAATTLTATATAPARTTASARSNSTDNSSQSASTGSHTSASSTAVQLGTPGPPRAEDEAASPLASHSTAHGSEHKTRARNVHRNTSSTSTGRAGFETTDVFLGESTDTMSTSTQGTARKYTFRAGQHGALRLSLLINPTSRELLVTVVEGRDMPLLGSDAPDSCVKVSLCSDQSKSGRRRTRTAKRTRTPTWNETLAPLKIARESVSDEMLRIQVTFENNSSSFAAETFLPLDRALRAFPENLDDWFLLQPVHSVRRRSGPKWLKRSGETSEFDSGAPFISFLNDRLAALKDTELDAEVKRYAAYRGKKWADIVPELTSAEGRQEKLANAVWELFSTEAAHLSVLSVLSNPFHRMLQEVKENKTDTRVKHILKHCKLDKIFGNIHELTEISLSFAKALESILVTRATATRSTITSSNPSNPESALVQTVLDVRGVADAFAVLQERLLEPEMRYRLQHERARRYVKRMLASDDDGPFALYVQWCQEDPRCDRHSLADLLTQPLQRLTRYPLLLKAILKHMPDRDPSRLYLEEQIAKLADAIDEHDRRMRMQDNSKKLRQLQSSLIWPSAMERSPNAFVSPVHAAYLGMHKPIDLRHQSHRYEEQMGMTDVTREHVCDGWLTTINRAGKEGDPLYIALVGDVLIIAKPQQMNTPGTALSRRSVSEDKVFSFDTARDSDDDSDDDDQLCVEATHHLCELVLLDVEDQTALVKNCFTIVVMGPFGTPASLFTLKAESAYDKTEWLKNLRKGIDTANGGQQRALSRMSTAFSSRDSTSTLASEALSRRESSWMGGLRAVRATMERSASRDAFARRRLSDAYYDEIGPDLPAFDTYAIPEEPAHEAQDNEGAASQRSPISSANSSTRGSHRGRAGSNRCTRAQRISERANRLSQNSGHITGRDLQEANDVMVPLRRATGVARRRGRTRMSETSDRSAGPRVSSADPGGDSSGSSHSLYGTDTTSAMDGSGGSSKGTSQSPSSVQAKVGTRGTMSVRSADGALVDMPGNRGTVAVPTATGDGHGSASGGVGGAAARSRLPLRRPNSADSLRPPASRQRSSGRNAMQAMLRRSSEQDVGEVSDAVHTPQPAGSQEASSRPSLASKEDVPGDTTERSHSNSNSSVQQQEKPARQQKEVRQGDGDDAACAQSNGTTQEGYSSSNVPLEQPVLPARSHITRLVSRYRKRLSTNLTDRPGNAQAVGGSKSSCQLQHPRQQRLQQLQEQQQQQFQPQVSTPALGCAQRSGSGSEDAGREGSQEHGVQGAPQRVGTAHGHGQDGSSRRSRNVPSPTPLQTQQYGSQRSRCNSRNGSGRQGSGSASCGSGSGSRQRVSSITGRQKTKQRESMLLALDGHDNSGTLV